MSFKTTFARPVFFVRWTAPSLVDMPRVIADFNRAYEPMGEPIPFVAIVPQDCAPPDEATRKSMTRARDEVLDKCVAMHLVMEGEGFRVAILRNALAAMMLFGNKRDKICIHRTLDEALDEALLRVPAAQRFDKKILIAKATAAGVATPPPAKEMRGTSGNR